MSRYKIGYFVGSMSSTSINRRLASALVQLAPQELDLNEIVIRYLPLYSQDYDADFPPVARKFKASDRRFRRSTVRESRVQPIDSVRAQEFHRLGQSP